MKHLNTNNRISEEDYDAMLNEVTPDLDIPSCWSNLKNDEYAPAYVTVPKVPAGVYEIGSCWISYSWIGEELVAGEWMG